MNNNTIETINPDDSGGNQAPVAEESAPEPATIAAVATEPDTAAATPDGGDDPDDEQADDADDQGDPLAKARRSAAKYRTALRTTEAERDQLRADLDHQRTAVITWCAAQANIDPALLTAAEMNTDELLDEAGAIDPAKVAEFITATKQRFNVATGFTPNRGQGASGTPPAALPPSLADAFRPANRY